MGTSSAGDHAALTERVGRPRDPQIDAALLGAVLVVLDASGYNGFTFAAVARQAGTTKPAIYRRWPNPQRLVLAALAQPIGEVRAPDFDRDLTLDLLGSSVHCRALFGHAPTTDAEIERAVEALLQGVSTDYPNARAEPLHGRRPADAPPSQLTPRTAPAGGNGRALRRSVHPRERRRRSDPTRVR